MLLTGVSDRPRCVRERITAKGGEETLESAWISLCLPSRYRWWLTLTGNWTESRAIQEWSPWAYLEGYTDGVNFCRKMCPTCGWHHFMGWGLRLNKRRKESQELHSLSALLIDCGCQVTSCLELLLPGLSQHDGLHILELWAKNNPHPVQFLS